MSGDFISREAAIVMATRDLFDGQTADYVAADIKEKLNAVPAADVVEVVHARPVKFYCDARTGRMITTCSACDLKIGPYDSFCKHCGAKLDGTSADYAPAKPYDLLYEEGGPDA